MKDTTKVAVLILSTNRPVYSAIPIREDNYSTKVGSNTFKADARAYPLLFSPYGKVDQPVAIGW